MALVSFILFICNIIISTKKCIEIETFGKIVKEKEVLTFCCSQNIFCNLTEISFVVDVECFVEFGTFDNKQSATLRSLALHLSPY